MGGQLTTGRRREPDRLHVFHVDQTGVLRCAMQEAAGWSKPSLPQAGGLPYGTDLHPAGALATGYQDHGRQLDVFAVDRDGMLRVYIATGNRSWEADVVPDATGIPPGACLATGYQKGGATLDVFTVGRAGEPLMFAGTDDGRWRAHRLPAACVLPHGANLATGYLAAGSVLGVFAIDRECVLHCLAQTPEGEWRTETLNPESAAVPLLLPGAPLATGYPGGGDELSVFVVDTAGRLREFRRGPHGWESRSLPGAGLSAPAALTAAYQDAGRRLVVFVVDELGRLRRYAHEPDDSWSVGLVPRGTDLPPGTALASGQHDGAVLELFVLSRSPDPPVRYTSQAGGWTGPHPI